MEQPGPKELNSKDISIILGKRNVCPEWESGVEESAVSCSAWNEAKIEESNGEKKLRVTERLSLEDLILAWK